MKLPLVLPVSQVDELERKVKSQQEQLFLTRQELTNTSAELKIRAIQAEGRHGQAWPRGDKELRRPPRRLTALPLWAPRALGYGEEESQTEYGRLGKASLQGGAVLQKPWALPLSEACRLTLCGVILPVHAPGR